MRSVREVVGPNAECEEGGDGLMRSAREVVEGLMRSMMEVGCTNAECEGGGGGPNAECEGGGGGPYTEYERGGGGPNTNCKELVVGVIRTVRS